MDVSFSIGRGGIGCEVVLWPQFQNWSGNDSGSLWHSGFIDKDTGLLAEPTQCMCIPPRCAARRGRTSLCLTEWVNRGVFFASVICTKLQMFRICGLWSKKGT